jgi:hypothetical protein
VSRARRWLISCATVGVLVRLVHASLPDTPTPSAPPQNEPAAQPEPSASPAGDAQWLSALQRELRRLAEYVPNPSVVEAKEGMAFSAAARLLPRLQLAAKLWTVQFYNAVAHM